MGVQNDVRVVYNQHLRNLQASDMLYRFSNHPVIDLCAVWQVLDRLRVCECVFALVLLLSYLLACLSSHSTAFLPSPSCASFIWLTSSTVTACQMELPNIRLDICLNFCC